MRGFVFSQLDTRKEGRNEFLLKWRKMSSGFVEAKICWKYLFEKKLKIFCYVRNYEISSFLALISTGVFTRGNGTTLHRKTPEIWQYNTSVQVYLHIPVNHVIKLLSESRYIFLPTFTKMHTTSWILSIFSKIRILHEADNTQYPFCERKHC